MAKVNYLLWESIERNQFVTAFYGILDGPNRTLSYSNAGHSPLLLVEANGQHRYIDRGNVPLGMFRDTRYHEYYLSLEPGDLLVLYTDGVTEANNLAGEEYGRDRLVDAVKDAVALTARELVSHMHRSVDEWTEGQGWNDDATFFVIKALK